MTALVSATPGVNAVVVTSGIGSDRSFDIIARIATARRKLGSSLILEARAAWSRLTDIRAANVRLASPGAR